MDTSSISPVLPRTPLHVRRHAGTHKLERHWWYIWIPLFSAMVWFGSLLALLITWIRSGRPHYVSMLETQHIAYISDVAADFLKPLFITGNVITAIGLSLSLSIERWARHDGRLLPNMRKREKVTSALAIIWSFVGGAGLILLSVFDTKRYPLLHDVFLGVFVAGTAISAFFTIVEFRWLNKTFGARYRALRAGYLFKAVFAVILISLAIPFGVLIDSSHRDPGAIIEWTIALLYTFYLLSFWWDLRQSGHFEKDELSPERLAEVGMREWGVPTM
ncbi:Frag1/DRAM/Sfk1 family-domain-containing protein [Phellopilus nigrolimitatus]|nr:Frag1/DRAM/Sfk1 family-domain-containing protein [Phellopilus nigrolimitatus]KAH8106659.1 Frag1/DRAM/Sfk1 family-domain-containing protein [Phellopilus nigrolimitatus]